MPNLKRLTRREFERALKRGHGRALLHVKEYGDAGIEEEIKRVLLKSHAYDVQVEGLRTWWLCQIVTATGKIQQYADHLLRNFNLPSYEEDDVAQQFELARFFFDLGETKFRPLMFAGFKRMAHESRMSSCGRALVEVSGLPGLELVARTCGGKPNSMDSYECSQVLERAIQIGYESVIMEHMSELGKKEPCVQAFMDMCDEFKTSTSSSSPRTSPPTLEDLLGIIQRNEQTKFGGKFRMFGKHATEDELAKVLDHLKQASNEQHQIAFLRVFQWRAMPCILSEVIDFLQAKNPQLRYTAATALSHTRSELVRNAALYLMHSGKPCLIPIAFELLENNYESDDSAGIIEALKRLKSATDIHSAGMAIKSICRRAGSIELEAAMLWLYENGPDEYCRSAFLKQLVDWRRCPFDLLNEAQWDAGSEVRDVARQQLAQHEREGKINDFSSEHPP